MEQWFVIILLLVMAGLFALDKIRPDLIALSGMILLMISGILRTDEALGYFANPTVIMIAALFVVGEGISRVGLTSYIGNFISDLLKPRQESKLTVILMSSIGFLGSFMSSTGVVALFVPIVKRITVNNEIEPRKIFLPVAYAGLISGMMTLIATAPNLIVSAELKAQGYDSFQLLDFTPIGLSVLILSMVYFVVRQSLGRKREISGKSEAYSPSELLRKFDPGISVFCFEILPGSAFTGKSIEQIALRSNFGINLLAERKALGRSFRAVEISAHSILHEGSVFYAFGREEQMIDFLKTEGVKRVAYTPRQRSILREDFAMAEVIIPYDSELKGRSLHQLKREEFYHLQVVSSMRFLGARPEIFPGDHTLRAGETLLVWGTRKSLHSIQNEDRELLILDQTPPEGTQKLNKKAPVAGIIIITMILSLIFEWIPPVLSIMIAALLMVLSGCIKMEKAYKSISWGTVILVACMLPFADAMEKTGSIDAISTGLSQFLTEVSPRILMLILFLITTLLSMFISNTATAVIIAPIAIQMAVFAEVSPFPIAMTIAIASSAAFLTPVSSPVNMLVVTAGDYRFKDFLFTGLPLLILTLILSVFLIPLFFPF